MACSSRATSANPNPTPTPDPNPDPHPDQVGDPNELATFEFLELPSEEDCADGAVVPLITRHLLTKVRVS